MTRRNRGFKIISFGCLPYPQKGVFNGRVNQFDKHMKAGFLLAGLILLATDALAATVTVSTSVDEVNGNTTSIANLIATPGGAGISLREAIIAANNTPGADTITLPAGTYQLTRAGDDSTCVNGDLDINGSLTLTGADSGTTFIQGANASGSFGIGDKVIGINQDGTFTNLTVFISGVTIRYAHNANLISPSFSYTGGGVDIFLTGVGNNITFSNCVIADNENVNAYGGGVNVDSGNSGLPGDPAVNTVNRGTVSFINCTITNNRTLSTVNTASGGGINLFADIHNVILTNCVIANNWASTNTGSSTGPGGGLYIRHTYGGTVTVANCNITNNVSGANGGGVVSAVKQTLNITGGIISGNSSRSGGGGFTCATDAGATTVTNVTISGNHADTSIGGGILDTATALLTLKNCVITNNSSVTGGGINVSGGTLVANYCRIVNNTATTGSAVAESGVSASASVMNNWWGTNAPAALMSGTITFTPWLQLTHTANPNTIFIPNTTTLTASFLTNSAGTAIPVANLSTLIGLPITFNNPVRGTLSGAQATIQSSGTATATFTPTYAGAGTADAKVDNATATAAITIPTGVVSINRVQTTPTNLASVQWTVTFTNQVTGVAAGNFSLVNSGLGGAPGITGVSAVGGTPAASWTVTASTGSGSGTLGLNMVNGTGVASIVNLPFTGQVYTIDLVPPDTSITAQPPSPTNSASASISFTGSDTGVGVASFQYQLDGGGYVTGASPANFTGLSNASHTFNVRAIDGVGNTDASPATVTWTVDTIPPTVNCSTDMIVTANGYCPPAVSYSVSVSDNLAIATATTNPASGSVFPLGTNTVTLTATDTAHNTNFCTFKVIVLPGAAPQLSIVRSGTNVVVSWTNSYGCYTLQYASAIASNSWSLYPGPFVTNNGTIYVTNSAPLTNRFYRLLY
jgi:hypothetical protein